MRFAIVLNINHLLIKLFDALRTKTKTASTFTRLKLKWRTKIKTCTGYAHNAHAHNYTQHLTSGTYLGCCYMSTRRDVECTYPWLNCKFPVLSVGHPRSWFTWDTNKDHRMSRIWIHETNAGCPLRTAVRAHRWDNPDDVRSAEGIVLCRLYFFFTMRYRPRSAILSEILHDSF